MLPAPVVDLALRLVLGDAVALLDAAGEFVALALNQLQIVVGELAPLLARLALNCFQLPAIVSQFIWLVLSFWCRRAWAIGT